MSRHALMGERIGLDVLNTIYDTSTAIAEEHSDGLDYEGFKLELFKTFAMESPFTEEEFKSMKASQLGDKLFENALQTFKRRMERMTQVANPVIKQVYEHQGAMYENIMIPVTIPKLFSSTFFCARSTDLLSILCSSTSPSLKPNLSISPAILSEANRRIRLSSSDKSAHWLKPDARYW